MDGPMSTNEAAGPAQQATSIPFRNPSVGPAEKVPAVSEGNRSRSSVRDEAGLPGKMNRNPAARDPKTEAGGSEKTQAPPYFVEFRERLESGTEEGRETLPLPGESSTPAPHEVLAEALAAAKARWAEVNREALEANTLPGQPLPDTPRDAAPVEGRDITDTPRTSSAEDVGFSSRALNPTASSGKDSPDVEMSNGLQHPLTVRYENLVTSLSNPHPTKPVIDLFV